MAFGKFLKVFISYYSHNKSISTHNSKQINLNK